MKLLSLMVMFFIIISSSMYAADTIAIGSPTDGLDTLTAIQVVTGTVSIDVDPADTINVYLNTVLQDTGVAINISDSTFTSSVTLEDNYDSIIVVLYQADVGDTISTHYYGTPTIGFTYPTAYDTNVTAIIITGTSSELTTGDTLLFYVDGVLQTDTTFGGYENTWSGTGTATGYGNEFTAVAADHFGRNAYDTITINYFATPTIGITTDTDQNFQTTAGHLSGTSVNSDIGDTVDINIAGTSHSIATISSVDGTWNGTVTLSSQETSANATYHSSNFGTQVGETITLRYFDTPSLNITTPTDGSIQTSSSITIGGTSNDVDTGDIVQIYINGVLNNSTTLTSLNESWTVTCTLPTALNSVVAVLTDEYARTFYDTIYVTLDILSLSGTYLRPDTRKGAYYTREVQNLKNYLFGNAISFINVTPIIDIASFGDSTIGDVVTGLNSITITTAVTSDTLDAISASLSTLVDSGYYDEFDSAYFTYGTDSDGDSTFLTMVKTHKIYILKTATYTMTIYKYGINGTVVTDDRTDRPERIVYTTP